MDIKTAGPEGEGRCMECGYWTAEVLVVRFANGTSVRVCHEHGAALIEVLRLSLPTARTPRPEAKYDTGAWEAGSRSWLTKLVSAVTPRR